jgi:hypothetical protein
MKATAKCVNLRHPDAGQAVQFYDQGGLRVDDLSKVVGTRLLAGGAAIVIATKAGSDDLARQVTAMGLDVARAASEGRYRAWLRPTRCRTSWLTDFPTQPVFRALWRC